MEEIQIQKEISTGLVYSERFAIQHKVRTPKMIKKLSDARFISKLHDNDANSKAVEAAFEIINDFDKYTDKIIKYYNKNPNLLDIKNLTSIIKKIKLEHNKMEFLLMPNPEIINQGINHILYIYAKQHFVISKIFFNLIDKIDLNDIKREKVNNFDVERFKLGVFIGLESVLITSIFSPYGRDNSKLINNYGKLVEKYSHMIALNYPDEYINATNLNKPLIQIDIYQKLVSYIEANRNG